MFLSSRSGPDSGSGSRVTPSSIAGVFSQILMSAAGVLVLNNIAQARCIVDGGAIPPSWCAKTRSHYETRFTIGEKHPMGSNMFLMTLKLDDVISLDRKKSPSSQDWWRLTVLMEGSWENPITLFRLNAKRVDWCVNDANLLHHDIRLGIMEALEASYTVNCKN
jgi:hypothetical protein